METDINVLLYFLCAIQIISNLWLTCNLKHQWRNTTRRLEELQNISAWFAQPLVRSPYACYRPPPPTLPCFSAVFDPMPRRLAGHRLPSRLIANKLQLLSEGHKIIFSNYAFYQTLQGTMEAQWLRCCDTNRKVAGSIPDSVSGFFIDTKSFRSHYVPVVDSASNRNEYQEYFLGVNAAGA